MQFQKVTLLVLSLFPRMPQLWWEGELPIWRRHTTHKAYLNFTYSIENCTLYPIPWQCCVLLSLISPCPSDQKKIPEINKDLTTESEKRKELIRIAKNLWQYIKVVTCNYIYKYFVSMKRFKPICKRVTVYAQFTIPTKHWCEKEFRW